MQDADQPRPATYARQMRTFDASALGTLRWCLEHLAESGIDQRFMHVRTAAQRISKCATEDVGV